MKYGLLGEKLGHSYSPLIHSYFGKYEYELIEKEPHELDDFFREKDFLGINVTIPYKKAVIPYLDQMDDAARRIGSVNTIIKTEDGKLIGYNTDYSGFLYTLRRSGIKPRGKKVIVLGSGGASCAVKAALQDMGAASVTVISRSGEDNYDNLRERHRGAQIIVNTTPVGMYPGNGESPVDLSMFENLYAVADIIANPAKTALLFQAEKRRLPYASGLPMLVAQAAYAASLFTGRSFSDSDIERAYNGVSKKTKNIVLIGMPGCGKTTVGRRIAKILGRELIDTDAMIVERIGMPIPEFFAKEGEDAFRIIESECASEACKKSGAVISTGGGIITREENREILSQNGTLVFINRPTSQLATRGRPISESNALDELAQKRLPIYKKWASVTVENIGVSQTAGLIISFLRLKSNTKTKK